MTLDDALNHLKGDRRKLAGLLGVTYHHTYKLKGELPQHHNDRLRIAKPSWFKKKKEKK